MTTNTRRSEILHRLETVIRSRRNMAAETSYVARLLDGGPAKCGRKTGEEAIEFVIAAISETDDALIGEAADLIFHCIVTLAARDIPFDKVLSELERREGTPGDAEKAARNTQ